MNSPNKQALYNKIISEYTPYHEMAAATIRSNSSKQKFMEDLKNWARRYANRAITPTNKNILNSYKNKFY